jgi:ATP-dependent 26S proteasome regulatory subunit
MQILKVAPIHNSKVCSQNVVTYNAAQFGGSDVKFLSCKGIIYPAKKTDDIEMGYIGLNQIVRKGHNLALYDLINVMCATEEEITDRYAEFPAFTVINVLGIKSDKIDIPSDKLQMQIGAFLSGYFLYKGQHLILKYDTGYLHLRVDEAARITDKIEFDVISLDSRVNIRPADTSLLKSKFFDPDFSFEDIGIGGLDEELKEIFKQAMTSRAYSPEIIKKLGIKHAKGILLYGPPGTGKTLIARQIGNLLSAVKPKLINGPEIFNKYVGQSEENIRTLFAEAIHDQEILADASPLHVFIFDEFDAMCKIRGMNASSSGVGDSVVNQLLSMIDGVNVLNNIFIIAMTNRKDMIDPAILRAGRIGIHIPISLPNESGRKQILRIHTQKMSENSMVGKDVDFDMLAHITDNYSGSELSRLVEMASEYALHDALIFKEDLIEVCHGDFMKAYDHIVPNMGRLLDESSTINLDELPINDERRLEITTNVNAIICKLSSETNIRLIITPFSLKNGTVKTKI